MLQLKINLYICDASKRLAPDWTRKVQGPDFCPGFFDFMPIQLAIFATLVDVCAGIFAIFKNMAVMILAIIATLGAVAVLKIANHLVTQNFTAL